MKVIGVETILLRNIEPYRGGQYWLFVELKTDEGITGLGERPTGHALDLSAQINLIHQICDEFVIGNSPFDIEKMWQNVYGSRHDYRHPSLYGTPALSAIEMACWDIVGKALNQPIYNLLGGRVHDRLRAYAYMPSEGIWEDPAEAGRIAEQLVREGNSACKFDPFTPMTPAPRDYPLHFIRHVGRIFQAIRDAVGDELEVAIGTHGQFSTAGAIRVAAELEQYSPYWFEEPVSPENVDEMARVAAQTSIPIASGERLVTKYEFSELLRKQAAQIIQVDVGQCGGILEAKKVASIAEAHYAMIAPHMYCGPVAMAAAVQLDACSPNFLIQEFNTNELHSQILREPIQLENGYLRPPDRPGLGIELDPGVVKRHLA